MNIQHVNVKIDLEGGLTVESDRIIEVFHGWIERQVMDELLIDVADYRHVPEGPGILLVGLEADYGLDNADGRHGLRYNRKAALEGSNPERFLQALRSAAKACRLLEEELGAGMKFNRGALDLYVNDRALAPNTPDTFAACKADLEVFLDQLGGGKYSQIHTDDPRRLFGVRLEPSKGMDFAAF